MKDSKVIVAVNTDPECAMVGLADYSLIADIFKAVPELTEKVRKR
jgi:electron transfer flavoprotein alpha subunit